MEPFSPPHLLAGFLMRQVNNTYKWVACVVFNNTDAHHNQGGAFDFQNDSTLSSIAQMENVLMLNEKRFSSLKFRECCLIPNLTKQ